VPKVREKKEGEFTDGRLKRDRSRKRKIRVQEPIELEDANGTVIEVFPGLCQVKSSEEKVYLCQYRRNAVFGVGRTNYRERSPVAVGDEVRFQPIGTADGVIDGVAKRTNQLARLAPGRDTESVIHVLVANVDKVVIVASIADPPFSAGLVDRFLIACQTEKIPVLLCINKIDLIVPSSKEFLEAQQSWKLYEEHCDEVLPLSCKTREGIEQLKSSIKGKRVVFCGHSGVGKTSLLRELLGNEVGKIGDVNLMTKKGKHTTTSAVLYSHSGNSEWIDTPGVKSLTPVGIGPHELKDYFQDVWDGVNEDRSHPRYASYHRLLEDLERLKD
jgi:ribosome biogenesis GTPase / thiamine phosphate phosphatase